MASTTHAKIVKLLNKNSLVAFARKIKKIKTETQKQQLKHTTEKCIKVSQVYEQQQKKQSFQRSKVLR